MIIILLKSRNSWLYFWQSQSPLTTVTVNLQSLVVWEAFCVRDASSHDAKCFILKSLSRFQWRLSWWSQSLNIAWKCEDKRESAGDGCSSCDWRCWDGGGTPWSGTSPPILESAEAGGRAPATRRTGLPALQNPSHHLHPTFSLSLSSSWRWHLPIFTHLIFLWFFRPYPTILILQILFPSQLTWKQGRRILYSHAAYIWIVLLFKYTKNSRRWENSLFKSGSGLQAEITLCFPNLFTFDHFLLAELPECQVKTRVVGRLPDAESNFVRGWYQSSKFQNLYNQICSFQSCV